MAMKFCVTFLVLISIGGIHSSKTLLEKIRDDSDLSQVSFNHLMRDLKQPKLLYFRKCTTWVKSEHNNVWIRKLEKNVFFFVRRKSGYITSRRVKRGKVLCNTDKKVHSRRISLVVIFFSSLLFRCREEEKEEDISCSEEEKKDTNDGKRRRKLSIIERVFWIEV